MRFIGLDYGQKRIGLAVSDSEGRLAVPVQSFTRSKDLAGDVRRLGDIINEYEPALVVVGNPVGLSGVSGQSAKAVRQFIFELGRKLEVEIVLQDERFSTHEASKKLSDAKLSAKAQRSVIDASAAAIILQAWLDRRVKS